jgi:hypothetical protein
MAKPLRIRIAALGGGMDIGYAARGRQGGSGRPGRLRDGPGITISGERLSIAGRFTPWSRRGDHMLDMGFRDELEAILVPRPQVSGPGVFGDMPRKW